MLRASSGEVQIFNSVLSQLASEKEMVSYKVWTSELVVLVRHNVSDP